LLRWVDADGDWGIGECACRPDPFYSGEFVAGAAQVVRDFVVPRLPRDGSIDGMLTSLQRLRGWPFTVAAVMDAAFDLLRRKGQSDPLDAWRPSGLDRVPVGIALGLFDEVDDAVQRTALAVEEGYRRIKFKVAPWMNFETLDAVRNAFPSIPLSFDANGSFGEDDRESLIRLASFGPVWIEQPFPPDRLDLHARLREDLPDLKVCLDESVESLGNLVSAHALGALDVLNLKPGRVGGVFASIRILEFCQEHQLPVWIGGMFETGIGRAANLRYAARLTADLAHDLSPSGRYFATDLVTEPIEMDPDGFVPVQGGHPVVLDESVIEKLTVRKTESSPPK